MPLSLTRRPPWLTRAALALAVRVPALDRLPAVLLSLAALTSNCPSLLIRPWLLSRSPVRVMRLSCPLISRPWVLSRVWPSRLRPVLPLSRPRLPLRTWALFNVRLVSARTLPPSRLSRRLAVIWMSALLDSSPARLST